MPLLQAIRREIQVRNHFFRDVIIKLKLGDTDMVDAEAHARPT